MTIFEILMDLSGANAYVLQISYGIVIVSIYYLIAGWGGGWRPRRRNVVRGGDSSPPSAEKPIQILYEDKDAAIDIIAVHGLAANPDYAWIWLPKNNPPGVPGYPEKHFNWLTELLPIRLMSSKISCRVMTFNYESAWFLDAPKQRLSNISDTLLDSLRNKRETEASGRPLIFIGHSFGGNLIEQAILSASRSESEYTDIAASTIGVIFLGTPHRGSAAAAWGSLLASLAPSQFGVEDRILKDLEEHSGTLIDRLHDFSRWLFSESVPVVCCFEKRPTDYSSRVRPMGKVLALKDLIVPETSACIDGHRKIALDTDHFKINKFYGQNDPSFKAIYPEIERMARNATEMLHRRRRPKVIPTNDHTTSGDLQQCLQEMRVSNPQDVLSHIRDQKGERLENTCEWILRRKEFTRWGSGDGSRLLRLVGSPGIGKTTISTFISEVLRGKIERSHRKLFAYFFFDDKINDRRPANAMLRSLVWQLLLQNRNLFEHIKSDFEQHSHRRLFEDLFDNSSAMLRIFQDMIQDEDAGEVFILVDALDECDKSTRKIMLDGLTRLFRSVQKSKGKLKLLITCRPEIRDIEDAFGDLGTSLRIDAANINDDLARFIDYKVGALAKRRRYTSALERKIKDSLTRKSGGTFLWVSLMVADLGRPEMLMHQVEEKLTSPPRGINEMYASILDQIDPSMRHIAKFILHCMVAAGRPLQKIEIQSAFATSIPSRGTTSIPHGADLQVYDDILSACSSIVNVLDPHYEWATLYFCHQSVKDFLLLSDSKMERKWYHITLDAAHLHMFHACWDYLTAEDFRLYHSSFSEQEDEQGRMRLHASGPWDLEIGDPLPVTYPFLTYTRRWWEHHLISSYPAVLNGLTIDITKTPIIRDLWLTGAADKNQKEVIRFLLNNGGNPNAKSHTGATALGQAVRAGDRDVVQMLIATEQIDGNLESHDETPLVIAVRRNDIEIAQILMTIGDIEVNFRDWYGMTALHWAAQDGHEDMMQTLVATGQVDWTLKDKFDQTAFDLALSAADKDITQWILETEGLDINSTNVVGNPPLNWFISQGSKDIVQYLLSIKSLDVNLADRWGNTALITAIRKGDREIVQWLLAREDVDINLQDNSRRSPITWAIAHSNGDILRVLLAAGKADLSSKDEFDETPLEFAVGMGNEDIVQMLVAAGGKLGDTIEDVNLSG